MTWNYQVVEHHEPGMPVWYGLHEVYRLKEGSSEITGVTLEPDAVGDSYDEVIQTLAMMLSDAIQRPLVVDSDGAHTERVDTNGSPVECEWLGPITPEDVARADAAQVSDPNLIVFDTKTGSATVSAQWHDDAAVGRKLREISEARNQWVVAEVVAGCVERLFCAPKCAWVESPDMSFTGPDALDRAHAEVCGSEDEPFNLGTGDGRYSAPAKPDYASMDDWQILHAAGLAVPDHEAIGQRLGFLDHALRAVLIDFLESRDSD